MVRLDDALLIMPVDVTNHKGQWWRANLGWPLTIWNNKKHQNGTNQDTGNTGTGIVVVVIKYRPQEKSLNISDI